MTARALRMCASCYGLRADEAGAPCVECNARGFTGTLSLAPPVLPTLDADRLAQWERTTRGSDVHDDDCATRYDEHADCDCDDPSAADLRWSDMEADRDAIRSACRRGL